jgi:hypothetical protein
MKFMKYLFTLVFAFCAFTSITKAQASVAFLGGGSSALFQELGSASQAVPGISCLWTYSKTGTPGSTPYIAANDGRTGINLDENGQIFIAWGPGSGTCAAPAGSYSIYAYIQLDSVIGDRCYFENDGSGTSGCTLKLQNTAGIVGKNVITTNPDAPVGITLPTSVVTALTVTSPHFFVAGTDIRPEDAKFATQRAFTACNVSMPRQFFNQDSYFTTGLGYQTGNPNLGTAIGGHASFGGGSFNVVNFNITGNDPISSQPVPAYSVSTIGAQPLLIAVAPVTDTQIAAMTDINGFTTTLFYQGVLGRTTDLLGTPGPAEAFSILVREPLSGTYNTFEYSIPNGTQYHASQDYQNCNGSGTVLSNPMSIQSGNGVFGTAVQRYRTLGTGNMVKFLQAATTPTMGYFFWSEGNAKGLTNVKYLKVNGIDPLLDAATAYNGALPGSTATGDPGIAHVGFVGLNAGNYPIWSALRLVGPPGNGGVSAMITALNTISSTQHDYILPSNLNVWHSHFFLNGQSIPTPANGATVGATTLCSGGTAESGGDAGGTNMLIINNAHFCQDYGVTNGLLNKTQ